MIKISVKSIIFRNRAMKQMIIFGAALVRVVGCFAMEAPPQAPAAQSNVETVTLIIEEQPKSLPVKKMPTYSSILEKPRLHEYKVPKEIAEQAEAIKSAMEIEPASTEFPLGAEVTSVAMNYIKKIMWAMQSHPRLIGKALLDQLEKEVSIDSKNAFDILYAANYLGLQPAIEFLARTIAKTPVLMTEVEMGALMKFFKKQNSILPEILTKIAWYYYLLYGKALIRVKGYGFSVQDYLDYRPELFIGKRRLVSDGLDTLNLSNLRLKSFVGLQAVPNIDRVQHLNLANNVLAELEPQAFQGLVNLFKLSLEFNYLVRLAPNAFQGLANLHELHLEGNRLTELPPTLFEGLNNLSIIILALNKLTYIAPETFHGLNDLSVLSLWGNSLSEQNKKQIRDTLPVRVQIIFNFF